MRAAETKQVITFLIVLLVVAHASIRGWWGTAAWTLLFDIVINLYPVMLQRYNRGRLTALADGGGEGGYTRRC